jgi:hypothetical protein
MVQLAWAAEPEWTAENPKPEKYNEREMRHLEQGARWYPYGQGEGRGYIAIQSTRPATINHMISDSPVGLLAWIWDKLVEWSDDYPWTPDEVCLFVSMYVFSRAGPDAASYVSLSSSLTLPSPSRPSDASQIYYEALHPNQITFEIMQGYIDVPLGIADFPVEICNSPMSWRHTMGPIVYQEIFDKGGHFAGWERPDAVAKGLCEVFGKGGGAYGVVKGKDGY